MLVFPNIEVFKTVIRDRIIPEVQIWQHVHYAYGPNEEIYLRVGSRLPRKALAKLRRFGVYSTKKWPRGLDVRKAISWLQIIPLEPAEWPEITPSDFVLFRVDDPQQYVALIEELLRLGNDHISVTVKEYNGRDIYLIKVKGPPIYSVLKYKNNIEKGGIIYRYIDRNIWMQIGWQLPYIFSNIDSNITLLISRDEWLTCVLSEKCNVADYINLDFDFKVKELAEAIPQKKINIKLRLMQYESDQMPSLWIIPETSIYNIISHLITSDIENIRKLDVAYIEDERNGKFYVLRAINELNHMILRGHLAYTKYENYDNVYLRVGFQILPKLRDLIKYNLFDDDKYIYILDFDTYLLKISKTCFESANRILDFIFDKTSVNTVNRMKDINIEWPYITVEADDKYDSNSKKNNKSNELEGVIHTSYTYDTNSSVSRELDTYTDMVDGSKSDSDELMKKDIFNPLNNRHCEYGVSDRHLQYDLRKLDRPFDVKYAPLWLEIIQEYIKENNYDDALDCISILLWNLSLCNDICFKKFIKSVIGCLQNIKSTNIYSEFLKNISEGIGYDDNINDHDAYLMYSSLTNDLDFYSFNKNVRLEYIYTSGIASRRNDEMTLLRFNFEITNNFIIEKKNILVIPRILSNKWNQSVNLFYENIDILCEKMTDWFSNAAYNIPYIYLTFAWAAAYCHNFQKAYKWYELGIDKFRQYSYFEDNTHRFKSFFEFLSAAYKYRINESICQDDVFLLPDGIYANSISKYSCSDPTLLHYQIDSYVASSIIIDPKRYIDPYSKFISGNHVYDLQDDMYDAIVAINTSSQSDLSKVYDNLCQLLIDAQKSPHIINISKMIIHMICNFNLSLEQMEHFSNILKYKIKNSNDVLRPNFVSVLSDILYRSDILLHKYDKKISNFIYSIIMLSSELRIDDTISPLILSIFRKYLSSDCDYSDEIKMIVDAVDHKSLSSIYHNLVYISIINKLNIAYCDQVMYLIVSLLNSTQTQLYAIPGIQSRLMNPLCLKVIELIAIRVFGLLHRYNTINRYQYACHHNLYQKVAFDNIKYGDLTRDLFN